jgi:hypothetical protein
MPRCSKTQGERLDGVVRRPQRKRDYILVYPTEQYIRRLYGSKRFWNLETRDS